MREAATTWAQMQEPGADAMQGVPRDPRRDVFAATDQASQREQVASRRGGVETLATLRLPIFFVIGVFVSLGFVFGTIIARLFGLPGFGLGVVGGAVGGVMFGLAMLQRRAAKPPKGFALQLPKAADETSRLRLVATAKDVHRVLHQPGLSEDAFEPRIFALRAAVPYPAKRWYAIWIVSIVLVSIAWTWIRVQYRAQIGLSLLGPWDYWAIMCIMVLPFMWTWPTYLRVSPGRLDVIRYRLLGAGTPRVRTIDLRDARVMVNLRALTVVVEPAKVVEQALVVQINQWGGPNTAMARAMFEAARWEGEHLRLPDDALVG
jgi:hypothetical protein